jgi:hypothetical protein
MGVCSWMGSQDARTSPRTASTVEQTGFGATFAGSFDAPAREGRKCLRSQPLPLILREDQTIRRAIAQVATARLCAAKGMTWIRGVSRFSCWMKTLIGHPTFPGGWKIAGAEKDTCTSSVIA